MNNWGYRKPKKQFVTFENLIAWGLQIDETDPEWGRFYNYARHFFAEAVKLFNGTYTYQKLKADGTTETVHYPNLGITEEDLLNHYFEEYGSRLCARPLEIGRISILDGQPMDEKTAMSVVLDITYRKTQKFVLFNQYKYLGLVKSTGFLYDPIENYRMVENGEDKTTYGKANTKTGNITETPTGSSSTDRTVKTNEVGHISVEGPIDDFDTDFKDGKIIIKDVSLKDGNETYSEVVARTKGTEAGKKEGKVSTGFDNGNLTMTATTGAGTGISATNYSTTYEDSVTDRKTGKTDTAGSSGEAEMISKTTSQGHIMKGRIESGNPSAFGYTDTESFTDRTDTTTYNNVKDQLSGDDTTEHSLTRSGNIGVTTSQQMIESERELVKFNVIDEFCKELNKEILLSVWS